MSALTAMFAAQNDDDWRLSSVCSSVDPELFFKPDRGSYSSEQLAEARKICEHCPVFNECYDYAMVNQVEGLWAGSTEDDRRRERRAWERENGPMGVIRLRELYENERQQDKVAMPSVEARASRRQERIRAAYDNLRAMDADEVKNYDTLVRVLEAFLFNPGKGTEWIARQFGKSTQWLNLQVREALKASGIERVAA